MPHSPGGLQSSRAPFVPALKFDSLIQGSDGNLYVSTENGGRLNYGALFQATLAGQPASLYSFLGYPNDGSNPLTGLVQHTDGNFYGTAFSGGPSPCNYGDYPGCGTIFSLDMGLPPFVSFINRAGRVGQFVRILGQGFTGASGVSFNGTPANFTVKLDTLILAPVPPGATTGSVTVATPSGTLTSNVPFYVIP